MEREYKCKTLEAIYKDEKQSLGSLNRVLFDISRTVQMSISIEQSNRYIRKILVIAVEDVVLGDLYNVLVNIERLFALFDGYFLKLSTLHFADSDENDEIQLNSYITHILNSRLSYFASADFCKHRLNCLVRYELVLTAELYYRWEQLLDELDVVNQMYLYSLSDSGIPVDIKCAFLIELAEPLTEILKIWKKDFLSQALERRRKTLKKCLSEIIKKYGVDIFKSELNWNFEKFLTIVVNSRVRIMHIKRKQGSRYFNGSESILYANKMSLLYRCVIFEILGINEKIYHTNLVNCVSKWDKWNDVLEQLAYKDLK